MKKKNHPEQIKKKICEEYYSNGLSRKEIEDKYEVSQSSISRWLRKFKITGKSENINEENDESTFKIDEHITIKNLEKKNRIQEDRIKFLVDEIERERQKTVIVSSLKENANTNNIREVKIVKSNKSAIVLQLSDWHYEEKVDLYDVNGLNEFNIPIAKKRIIQLCNEAKRRIDMYQSFFKSDKLIIALQGDFISGGIHEELMETNQLLPADAILEVQNEILGLLDFFEQNTNLPIEVVFNAGNHGRMTKKQRIMTEMGHSLESYMYHIIEDMYKGNKRFKFHTQRGYHVILDINGCLTRFHHGHWVKYNGGVSGISLSLNKAINNWNRSIPVKLDVLGHFHTSTNLKNCIVNGSLIGFNAYANSIKAEYEEPSQNIFVIEGKKGVVDYARIILN